MINFTVKNCDSIQGGLCFQLIPKFDDSTQISLDKVDCSKSIACSENAFAIIEYVFSSDRNDKEFYHWSLNIHDRKSIKDIILRLKHLINMFNKANNIKFIYSREDLLNLDDERETLKNGIIKLAWSTDEMREELEKNITHDEYRIKIVSFIDKIIFFLEACLLNVKCTGIYVSGV